MSDKILSALAKLDFNNDQHWTGDGLPRLETVRFMASDQSLTREMLNAAAPGFSRAAAAGNAQPATTPPPPPPAPPVAGNSGATATEQVAVAGGSEAEWLEAEIQNAETALSAAIQAAADAKVAVTDCQNALAQLEARKRHLPTVANENPITGYLASQVRVLEERAARMKVLDESGINLKDLARDLKSPLDAAISNRKR